MFKSAKPLFLIVETSLHAGSGSDLGIVDLPIQREKHTGYPKIEASGIKGAIREIFSTQPNLKALELGWNITSVEDNDHKKAVNLTFGPDTSDQSNLHAGALGFTDARLLLFPVKSVSGVFGWITCPAVLERFKHDLSICQPSIAFDFSPPEENQVPIDSELIINDSKIVLEEYTFEVKETDDCKNLADWIAGNCMPSDGVYTYWRNKIKNSLVVLSNDDFRDFVTLSTEVIARIKIDQKTGTVEKGALWYEEYLPSDSILYSLALASPIFRENDNDKGIFQLTKQDRSENRNESEKVIEFLEDGLPSVIQLGGNATIGKGIVRTKI
ncbi:MAG: type III-B CRISPR module RAMP protein Cmr4 [Candidatus Poribacteria bacterium]|nr:type III-B CRISPR module RAMP protein Cmr4 [Candidatus Poribacteria bacterium]